MFETLLGVGMFAFVIGGGISAGALFYKVYGRKYFGRKFPAEKAWTPFAIGWAVSACAILFAFVGGIGASRFGSKDLDTRMNIRDVAQGLREMKRACGKYPTTREGLSTLSRDPASVGCKFFSKQGFITERSLKDGHGRVFSYESDGKVSKVTASDGTQVDIDEAGTVSGP
jgi:hypothetical protein